MIKVLLLSLGLAVSATAAQAALPTPLVDLKATTLTAGAITSWDNYGSLGGKFNVTYGTQATAETVAGRKAVTFDGKTGMTSTFTPPAGITGANAQYTVAFWFYNPQASSDEYVVTWAPRNKGDGTYVGYGIGNQANWGFASHWGMNTYDMPYGEYPTTSTWHHVAVTYDGSLEKLYVDGTPNNSGMKKLNLGSEAFKLAFGDTSTTNPLAMSGSLANLQIYDKVLTRTQIIQLYGATPVDAPYIPTPLLDLDAYNLTTGPLAKWNNLGNLGGAFTANQGTSPTVSTVAGFQAVNFSGSNTMVAPFGPTAALQKNATYTVAFWAYNPVVSAEEWILEWAPRNKGNGTYAAFGFGSQGTWGVAAHWGGQDFSWGTYNGAGVASAATWHHIAISFNGSQEVIYVDGAINNRSNKTLNLGAKNFLLGGSEATNIWYSGAISKLQVWDFGMNGRQIQTIYNAPRIPVNPVKSWSLFE